MNVQIKQDDLRGGVTLANLFDKLNPKTLCRTMSLQNNGTEDYILLQDVHEGGKTILNSLQQINNYSEIEPKALPAQHKQSEIDPKSNNQARECDGLIYSAIS
tara:strand:+ start:723 stop:1031 length:309 start_codon:yes stop_codon:yes gene_type:complete